MADTKQQLREATWTLLEAENVAAFPFPPEGRIPNFKGSNDAARKLRELDVWKNAGTIKANPDAPQRKIREFALMDGKRLFMAVPRLRARHPFREIVPGNTEPQKAVTLSGSEKHGQPLPMNELPHIELIVTGSVAMNPDGRRLGKGGGYSDLEFALLFEHGKINTDTVIVTTVHELQLTEEDFPFNDHDVPVDIIVTPERVIETNTTYSRPEGIDRVALPDSYIEEIPVFGS